MAQLNLIVGDIESNIAQHLNAAQQAKERYQARAIVFPELSITGYPPEDLLLRNDFINAATQAVDYLQHTIRDIYCVIGHPLRTNAGLENCVSIIYNGTLISRYSKRHLPNYGVFDEARYFIPGQTATIALIDDIRVGILICEDLWYSKPAQELADLGAQLIVAVNASPFTINKHQERLAILHQRTQSTKLPIIYVNQYGAQDDLIFDGGSMAMAADSTLAQLSGFNSPNLHPVHCETSANILHIHATALYTPPSLANIYHKLLLGIRDYINKNHLAGVIVGISGGIDSALTLTLAIDALGLNKVRAVFLPSLYTQQLSYQEASTLASNLQINLETIEISNIYKQFLASMAYTSDGPVDITKQNLQARCRAVIMLGLANASNAIVLITANRSELAVGYSTIYGDLAGGFAPLKDISKTLVYQLAEYRNSITPVIPLTTINREPSAELAPGQLDSDHLPPYQRLDQILALYLEQGCSLAEIVAQGFAHAEVSKILNMIKRSEYKRRTLPPGCRINYHSFTKDRRYPNTIGG